MIQHCSDCGSELPPVKHRRKPDCRCRPCARATSRSPEANKKRSASMRSRLADPNERARIAGCTSAGTRRALATKPALLELRRQLGRQLGSRHGNRSITNLPAGHPTRVKAGASISRRLMGWCPGDRRTEYRRLRNKHGAAAARQIMEERFAAERQVGRIIAEFAVAAELATLAHANGWPPSFLYQLERVRSGAAGIVTKYALPRVDHGFSLGGSSAAMCAEAAH